MMILQQLFVHVEGHIQDAQLRADIRIWIGGIVLGYGRISSHEIFVATIKDLFRPGAVIKGNDLSEGT
jgi:hypothetical protein